MKLNLILIFLFAAGITFAQTSGKSLTYKGKNFVSIGSGGNIVLDQNGTDPIWGMGVSVGAGYYFTDNFAAKINLDYSFFFSQSDDYVTGMVHSETDDVGADVYFYEDQQNQAGTDLLLMISTSFRERSNMYLLVGPGMTFTNGSSEIAFSGGVGYSIRIGDMSSLNIEGVYRTGLGGYFPIRVSFSQAF
ncbi:MAG TPA: hypothetical protein VK004_05410 [Ignavibacteria bacterium]|nr:hypothetical protein [Ignavibacteria bacterium]